MSRPNAMGDSYLRPSCSPLTFAGFWQKLVFASEHNDQGSEIKG